MKAPQDVLTLVERFTEHREEYLSAEYNEATLRKEFLEPLFRAIGWDVDNTKGYAEAYKEVVHEDAIKVSGATKAPDYAFRLGGARKFFVEAKKPSVDVKGDPSPAYQLRRYAWSAKLPLSILTDFHEFAVYDCTKKPSLTDTAATGRILYLTYEDYAERWEEIPGLFSPEAIQKGAFDQFAASAKGKKGTAAVDDAFLDEIEAWRDLLARNLALRNPGLSQRELNDAVQTTIDRIIFLRICEDRGIENYGALQALLNGTRVYPRLVELFRAADDRYNSGLFHFRAEKDRPGSPDTLTLSLEIDDKVLKEILGSLYYPVSPYEFSVLPADLLGHVYEQFLGKVIRLTPGHRAVVEEKPEVKKAGGVYYTPTYIVDYIVKNTVGKLLEGKTPKEAATLGVLDPACGSGSFLLGAYQCLLDWHRDWYTKNAPEKWARGRSPKLYHGPKGDWRLTTAERKGILLDHLHGVDIDPQAVEVTKLSLLLKVLEGENAETLGKTLKLLHERALPDLGRNIQCGNSLIGSDFYDDHPLESLTEEERYRINAFDWETAFPDIMNAGGFDAVIGNPPYIRVQRISHDETDYFFSRYETPASKTDLSQLFLERSVSLMSEHGLAGLICTSQWMTADYGRRMRALLSQGLIQEIVDFGSLPVFPGASTYPAIFVIGKSRRRSTSLKRVESPRSLTLEEIETIRPRNVHLKASSEEPWNLYGLDLVASLVSHKLRWEPLGSFAHPYIGTLTGMDRAFVLAADEATGLGIESGILFPYAYRGEEVRGFEPVVPQSVVLYPYLEGEDGQPVLIPEPLLRRDYPRAFAHLSQFRDLLVQRRDSRRLYAASGDWYRHLRPGSFHYIRPMKLLVKGLGNCLATGTLGENTCFNGANCPGLIMERPDGYSLEFLLGLLNSRLAYFHLRSVCPPKLGGYTRFNARSLARLPIPVLDSSDRVSRGLYEQLVSQVQSMIVLRQQVVNARAEHERILTKRQIDVSKSKIDQLVYEIYGLTDEEIYIVEGTAR